MLLLLLFDAILLLLCCRSAVGSGRWDCDCCWYGGWSKEEDELDVVLEAFCEKVPPEKNGGLETIKSKVSEG